jgi:hypothetical protein
MRRTRTDQDARGARSNNSVSIERQPSGAAHTNLARKVGMRRHLSHWNRQRVSWRAKGDESGHWTERVALPIFAIQGRFRT